MGEERGALKKEKGAKVGVGREHKRGTRRCTLPRARARSRVYVCVCDRQIQKSRKKAVGIMKKRERRE